MKLTVTLPTSRRLPGIILFLWIMWALSGTAFGEIVFVVNEDTIQQTVSKKDLQDFFLGKKLVWNDGTEIKLVLVKGGLYEEFVHRYVHRSLHQFNRYWRKMVFTGKGMPPKQFNSEAEALAYIIQTKGAIGFIAPKTPIEKVKRIQVTD